MDTKKVEYETVVFISNEAHQVARKYGFDESIMFSYSEGKHVYRRIGIQVGSEEWLKS